MFYLQAEQIKSCMLPVARTRNGLGDPPAKYYTNDNESMNAKFKRWQKNKAEDLPQFIENVQQFVQQDHSVVQAAFAGQGDYRLIGPFRSFFVGERWWTMTTTQRQAHQKKFIQFTAKYPSSFVSKDASTSMIQNDVTPSLASANVAIAQPIVDAMINKAKDIVSKEAYQRCAWKRKSSSCRFVQDRRLPKNCV